MTGIKLSGECVRNDDGSCTITVRPEKGSECGCANLSLTVNCDCKNGSDSNCC